MKRQDCLWCNERGYAVVEATILFPIIIMIFAGLILLSMYLPARANLQRATQYAATAIATERSDTWLRHDPETSEYYWIDSGNKEELGTVYGALFGALVGNKRDDEDNAKQTVLHMEEKGLIDAPGMLKVEYGVLNYVVYKEIVITATKTIPMPVDLSFVNFPREIPITVTSTAVVQNGDEFVRNMDLTKEYIDYLSEKYNLDQMFSGVSTVLNKFQNLLGL